MKIKAVLILILLSVSLIGNAQPVETTYFGTTIKEGSANNVSYGPFDIGFQFTFFGNPYNQFYVSSNGLVTFGAGSTVNAEAPILTAELPNDFIAPFWDDLVIDGFGNILYTTIGASPNKKLIIQFRNMGFYPSPVYLGTFSVILYETSNKIQTQYRMIVLKDNDQARGGSALIGIENFDGTSGVEYAYHNPAAVSSWKAISYTPSGLTYLLNTNAIYDGIYLTKNLTLPEPGITDLLSPSDGSTVGTDVTFEWGASQYATEYYLRLATNPSMTGATTYNAGSNLTYAVSGLNSGTTYYWTILASNATGYTWNEVKSFTPSSNPPLTPVPQTIWTELGQDKTIKLNYTGGDVSPKTAIVTSLPAQGQLYQYIAGTRGSQITAVPTTLTDPNRNVIYAATGSSGNGVGNFNFKINDANGDSPEAAITVNVSPAGVPNVLNISKNINVEIELDLIMADPTGKQSQFEVKVNGIPVTINTVALKTGDPYTLVLNLATPLTGTETVLVSYTMGDVASTMGGFLFSFTDQSATLTAQIINFAQSLTRKWNESPLTLTAIASSGLGMTYSSSNPSVATAAGSVLTFHALGSSDITARQAGNATYAPAKYIKTLTVSKGDQTITFNALPEKTLGDPDFDLAATASSGLTVSFSSGNPAVATITGTTVHIVAVGTSVITASQAGSTLWNPAADVPRTLTVNNPTGVEDPAVSKNSFKIYTYDNHINIQTLADNWDGKTGSVKIIDLAGKSIGSLEKTEFSKNSLVRIPTRNTRGLYLVEIRAGDMRYVGRVVVR